MHIDSYMQGILPLTGSLLFICCCVFLIFRKLHRLIKRDTYSEKYVISTYFHFLNDLGLYFSASLSQGFNNFGHCFEPKIICSPSISIAGTLIIFFFNSEID